MQGKAAVQAPEKPVIESSSVQCKNKRAEFTFNTVSVGDASVSDYQAGYSIDGQNYTWIESSIPFTQDIASSIISGLENNITYYII